MKASLESLQAVLSPLVGGMVRVAEDADTVAGVRPRVVVEPRSEEEVSAVVSFANQEGLKVLVRGGGTQLGVGFPPTGGDIILSMLRLNQLIEHAPQDLTASVQAGISLTDFQTALASADQWLALDPVLGPGATIGGIIATNASGAHRLRFGGVRDQIIGIRVVLPDGTIAKGGGKVVKNVAGYDLPKLFTGSLGTLGVIVTATFRLYPLPLASRTVVLIASDPASLCELAVRVIGSTLIPTMIDIFSPTSQEEQYTLGVRFEMGPEAADDQSTALIEMAGKLGETAQKLSDEAEEQFWSRSVTRRTAPNTSETTLSLKASVLPTEVARWLESLQHTIQRENLSADWRAHAGHGLIYASLSGDTTALITAVDELRQVAMSRQGSLVITNAPYTLASQPAVQTANELRSSSAQAVSKEWLDMWGTGSALEVMRRIKARFDPEATLNPGRFVGGI